MRAVLKKISNVEIAKLGFFLGVLLLAAAVFIFTPSLLPSTLLSVLLFFIFAPLIDSLESRGVNRTSAITFLFLVCACAIAIAATLVAPRMTNELATFQAGSSKFADDFTRRVKAQEDQIFGTGALGKMLKEANLSDKGMSKIQASVAKLWTIAPDIASNLMVAFLLVPFLTFVLLKDSHEIRRSLLRMVPNRYFETVYSIVSRILDQMGGYVAARIFEAFLVAALVTIGCMAAQIPYAILLGIFAGATNAIPYLGPVIGAIPGLALAILEPSIPSHLFWILSIYLVANLIDMLVIFPVVVARIVDLHPVVVVISVMLGSQLFGIVGMLVAVPITSIFKILISELYTRVYNQQENVR